MAHIFALNRSNSGVPKLGVYEARATVNGLEGDQQDKRKLKFHGGPQRALCLYSLEHILDQQAEGHPIFPGATGENVTISGLDWDQLGPGVRLELGTVEIEITDYTVPCRSIAKFFKGRRFSRIGQHVRPGWSRLYAKVIKEGQLKVGMPVQLLCD